MNKFVTIEDQNKRRSSLQILADRLVVVGILPHGSLIKPASIEDANELIAWLIQWEEAQCK